MADSEDDELEKTRMQELSLEINTLCDNFHQNSTVNETSPESQTITRCRSKLQVKKYCSFCHNNNLSVSTCYRILNMLKESKPPSASRFLAFYHLTFKNTMNR